MPMLKNASSKYRPFNSPELPDRTWPSKKLTKAPRWLSTDLRDGNQALASPLTLEQKWAFFQLLVKIGFKEIEVGFPHSSNTDYNFSRKCAMEAPRDLWLQVMCPCQKDVIRRTVECMEGASRVIVSLYIATSDTMIETVFKTTREKQLRTAVEHVLYFKSLTKDRIGQTNTCWNLMWSPETFSDTDTEYAIEICREVRDAWEPTVDLPMILNLPATVEMSTPNTYADQVEIFSRGFSNDPSVCVSLHTHNDRGCAVAAAELGQLAGATRVEGCLFGNGERTGNVDLVTLALNLYTRGVDPGLDFSKLPTIRSTVEDLTQIPVHLRAPYAGDAVFWAYSGGHQDAIKKGLDARLSGSGCWNVPYLTMDPRDIGRSYEALVRVNSQSGTGGIAFVLKQSLGLDIPKVVLRQLSLTVKSTSEAKGRSLDPDEIIDLFFQEYDILQNDPRIASITVTYDDQTSLNTVKVAIIVEGRPHEIVGSGPSGVEAVRTALAAFAKSRLQFESVWSSLRPRGPNQSRMVAVQCTGEGITTWKATAAQSDEDAHLFATLSSALDWMKQVTNGRKLV